MRSPPQKRRHALSAQGRLGLVLLSLWPLSACIEAQMPKPRVELGWMTVRGGTYTFGGCHFTDSQECIKTEEYCPEQLVTVPSFLIMRAEVTVAQYRPCIDAGHCPELPYDCIPDLDKAADEPIRCVSWEDAQLYAEWVGQGARLPREAEWEYVARGGGAAQPFPWPTSTLSCEQAAIAKTSWGQTCEHRGPKPVCSFSDGTAGQELCDLIGNVAEWVQDPHGREPGHGGGLRCLIDEDSPYFNGEARVVRGGSWSLPPTNIGLRAGMNATRRPTTVGFRLARDMPEN